MPRVSIITATYNRGHVLRWTIESVRAQKFRNYEHLVVGDACTDDTADIVAAFADPRLRFLNRAVNFGEQSGPNNDGFAASSGELIAYVNHDDLWFFDHLADLVRAIDATGADLVYALPVSMDRHGMAFCGLTNAERRYDPSHFVPASLWVARRELVELLGGWRPARSISASNPSQEFLFRAWRQRKDLRCTGRLTALLLPSGGRPGSYLGRDDAESRELWQRMQAADFRERLLTEMVVRAARQTARTGPSAPGCLHRIVDRVLVSARLHPDAVRNRLAGRPPGWWIEHLRELRGLTERRSQ